MKMNWKMFEMKGKFGSAKEKVFRLIGGLRKEGSSVSSLTRVSTVAPYETVNSLTNNSLARGKPKTFNLQAYVLAKQRMHELEGQKAMVILLSRHERWKAGGPL